MVRTYSIADARNHLSEVVRTAESEGSVTLTRRGRSVAVVVAEEEYRRLRAVRPGFWDAISAFRASVDISDLGVGEIYQDVRDRSPGRGIPE